MFQIYNYCVENASEIIHIASNSKTIAGSLLTGFSDYIVNHPSSNTIQLLREGSILNTEIASLNAHNATCAQTIEVWAHLQENILVSKFVNLDGTVAHEFMASSAPHSISSEALYDDSIHLFGGK